MSELEQHQSLSTDNSTLNYVNMDDSETYHSYHCYENIAQNIIQGNIKEEGPLIDTPENMSINLKLHQKRMVSEMLNKENIDHRVSSRINGFILADKVGSGKSIVVLGLIANSRLVNEVQSNKLIYKTPKYSNFLGFHINANPEFKTNLIVIPHGIYNQWFDYIIKYTKLTYYGVSYCADLKKIPYEKMLNGECDVILVKSTKYNDFMKEIYTKYPYSLKTETSTIDNQSMHLEQELYTKIYSVHTSIREHNYNATFLLKLAALKNSINKIDIDKLKEDIEKAGKYRLDLINQYSGPVFQRVFIDEANSIKIARCMVAYGKVNWFITSSVEDLLYPNGRKDYNYNKISVNGIKGSGFIKDTFIHNSGKNLSNFIQELYLKNNDKFVENSFNLPEPIENKISCFTPAELKILQDLALPEVIQALNAGDTASAISKVGCSVSNEESIVNAVLKNLNIEYETKTNQLKVKNTLFEEAIKEIDVIKNNISSIKSTLPQVIEEDYEEITDPDMQHSIEMLKINKENLQVQNTTKSNLQKSIKNFTEQINNLQFKIDSLKSRITNIKDKECPICTLTVSVPIITPCCRNIFCFSCIAQALHVSNNMCPLCRDPRLDLNKLTIISSDTQVDEIEEDKLPTKLESLINLINSKPDGRFLVFSEYENSFNEIVNEFNKNGITYSKLCGSTGHITNLIKKYTSNQIRVLLLNAKHYGSGLNLQMTSDIVIYHRMTNDLEKQIIGRGQRIGRENALIVNYLCYENEI